MKIKSKLSYFFIILFFLIIFSLTKAFGNDEKKFLTLKNNEVNVRVGPSKKYPIKFTYKKKYLPVEILDKFENWKKIKDLDNNSGWVHTSLLSKRKSAINIKNNSVLYKKPTIYSKPIAKLEQGRLVLIKKCKEKWCKINSGNYEGWVIKNFLWGNIR